MDPDPDCLGPVPSCGKGGLLKMAAPLAAVVFWLAATAAAAAAAAVAASGGGSRRALSIVSISPCGEGADSCCRLPGSPDPGSDPGSAAAAAAGDPATEAATGGEVTSDTSHEAPSAECSTAEAPPGAVTAASEAM